MSYAFRLTKPYIPIQRITVQLNGEKSSLYFGPSWNYKNSGRFMGGACKVFYEGKNLDTWISHGPHQPIILKNQQCIDVLCDNLEIMLMKETDKLDIFEIKFVWCEDRNLSSVQLQEVYKRLSQLKTIHVDEDEVAVNDIKQARDAFSCFDFRVLRRIDFLFVCDNIELPANTFSEVLEIEQLKYVEASASFKVDRLPYDDIRRIREIVINSGIVCMAILHSSIGNNFNDREVKKIVGSPDITNKHWHRYDNIHYFTDPSRIEIQSTEWRMHSQPNKWTDENNTSKQEQDLKLKHSTETNSTKKGERQEENKKRKLSSREKVLRKYFKLGNDISTQTNTNSEHNTLSATNQKTGISNGLRVLSIDIIMRNILQYVGLGTISDLRRVSRGVRNCVDVIKPDPKIEAFAIDLRSTDYLYIETWDTMSRKHHKYQTMFNSSYKHFWDDEQYLDMNNDFTYPSYEFYYFPHGHEKNYPNECEIAHLKKDSVLKWYKTRLTTFSNNWRLNLLNQRRPIKTFSITMPLFGEKRHPMEHVSMKGHEIAMFEKFLNLKVESRICAQCRATDEIRFLGNCSGHRTKFHQLIKESQANCLDYSQHPARYETEKHFTYLTQETLFMKYLEDVLESVEHLIPVEALIMQACEQNSVMTILKNLDPHFLKTISVQKVLEINKKKNENNTPYEWVSPLVIDEIGNLDQWKSARCLKIENLIDCTDIKLLAHFSEIDVRLVRLTMTDILCLKREFLLSHNFAKFKATFETSDIDERDIDEDPLWGVPDQRGDPNTNRPSVWSFYYPASLDFVVVKYYAQCKRIIFARVVADMENLRVWQ